VIAALAIAPAASAKTTKRTTHKTTVSKSAGKTHKVSTAAHSKSRRGHKTVAKKSWKTRGQQAMSSDRTRTIQEALIREHYLSGEPNGVWDSRTQEACRKFQAANGWQAKVTPDSRALIKLGLGPDHSELLNPETAQTSMYAPGGGEKSSSAAMLPATAVVR
jgi:peptidoglycan hydrolase-like protein with peptidoglycan-binding domain